MDYNECIAVIGSTEAQDTESRSVVADVYDLGPEVEIREYAMKDATVLIDMLEGEGAAQPKIAPQPSAKLQQTSKTTTKRPIFGESARSQSEKNDVARQLESGLADKAKFVPKIKESDDDLVMPSLSLQDQISELEKISMGLDRSAFNDEQMAIITKEIVGVRKTSVTPVDDFQRNLLEIRNIRLKEVYAKLGI